MRLLVAVLLSFAGFLPTAPAQSRATPDRPVTAVNIVDSGPEVRRQAFDFVWQTINDKHFDPKFGGVDWQKVKHAYLPRLDTVNNDRDFHRLLQEMLGELKQSHFNIIPPEAVVDDTSNEPKTGGIGIDVRVIDGSAVVVKVEGDGTAARAGFKPGYVIKQIDQTPVAQIVDRLSKSKLSPAIVKLQMSRAVLARLNGEPETDVELVFLDDRDRSRKVSLQRIRLKGEMSPALGNFPPQYTEFESRLLPDGTGYIRFNMFANSLMPKIREAIRSMRQATGIIFDLRGNPGGFGGMSNGIAGLLETRQISLGTMRFRTGYQNFAVFPQANP
jgi:carboxyl-terminal processing protease